MFRTISYLASEGSYNVLRDLPTRCLNYGKSRAKGPARQNLYAFKTFSHTPMIYYYLDLLVITHKPGFFII